MAVAAILGATVVLAACASGGEKAPILSIGSGTCFTADESSRTAFIVPCTEPHLYEVTGRITLDEGDFPGDAALTERAQQECPIRFTAYTGTEPALSSDLVSLAFTPSATGWSDNGDRTIVCVASPASGSPVSTSAARQSAPADVAPSGAPSAAPASSAPAG